ncbi:MAG TPA: serine/threonine-protein kinase [Chitinispirillaceae bacterium]|nr:serine/threonine-protein kinase [Chitinispirillaceae bacterium]
MAAINDDPKDKDQKISDSEWIRTVSENSLQHSPVDQQAYIEGLNSIPDAKTGDQLGSGRIVSVLGEGGMGRVYKIWCEDLELFRAVKVVLHSNDISVVKRFQREAKLTAKLDQSNIVRLYGTGIWKGCRYIEMEYIEGTSFDVLLKQRKKLDISICAAIGLIVAKVLAYAHNHNYTLDGAVCSGVIHRDLKPSNLMLTSSGKLKVLDFGIARPLSTELLTLTTGVVGSLYYLPPEQLDGSDIDYRADIYSLGAVLYELASGQVAFPFNNHREFYTNKSRGIYTPLIKVLPHIPDKFSSIVDCCLNVNPKHRFNDASELIEELKDYISTDDKFSSIYDENTDCLRLEINPSYNQQPDSKKSTRSRTRFRTKTHIKKPRTKKYIVLGGISVLIICAVLIWQFHSRIFDDETVQPDPPVLLYPKQNQSFAGDSISFVWKKTEGVSFYNFEMSLDKDFAKQSYLYHNLTDTFLGVVLKRNGRPLYWRVASCIKEKCSVWSESFAILPSESIAVKDTHLTPILIQPVNNQKNVRLPVKLSWCKTAPSILYSVQISSNSDFRTIINEAKVTDTFLILKYLTYNKTFFWRVGCAVTNDSMKWSSVQSFITQEKPMYGAEQLSKIYKTSKMTEIALMAIGKKQISDAEEAIKHIDKSNSLYPEIVLRLADCYLNMRMPEKARQILSGIKSDDALFFICSGRILLQENRYSGALEFFKTAQSKSSVIFNFHQIIHDASYYYAETIHNIFINDPTFENKEQALKAWEIIITKLYKSDKTNPRFKHAVQASNQIAQVPVK